MTQTMRSLAHRIADALLPQTTAAAGCAYDCWRQPDVSGSQMYGLWCCTYQDCRTRCN
ncbi:hypothetical protein [Streptomyces sp. NPDC007369]|uniref:hypothetical protein n=1 Tax=Streptomyces sp. NPDC007369 TaxID=3154589 RepID=UPI0033FDF183